MSDDPGHESREDIGYELSFGARTWAKACALMADLRERGLTIDGRSPEQVMLPAPLWQVVAVTDSHWAGDPRQVAAMEQFAARHGCDFHGWRQPVTIARDDGRSVPGALQASEHSEGGRRGLVTYISEVGPRWFHTYDQLPERQITPSR